MLVLPEPVSIWYNETLYPQALVKCSHSNDDIPFHTILQHFELVLPRLELFDAIFRRHRRHGLQG